MHRRRGLPRIEPCEPRLLLAAIVGTKFNDLNGNGLREAGEPGLGGWTIYLDANHNGRLDAGEKSTLTGSDGGFVFSDLSAGNYLVAEVHQAGWRQTGPNMPTPAPAEPAPVAASAAVVASQAPPEASHFATEPHRLMPRAAPNDPLFQMQWSLLNSGQSGGTAGWDAKVLPVWESGVRGSGVVIGIVDDGIDYSHPDLAPNYSAALSYDFNENDPDAAPRGGQDNHGTAQAGIAAARGGNGIGISGAAPGAAIASLRILGGEVDDATEAAALLHLNQQIHIYNNSWGPNDDGETLEGPGPLTLQALRQGVLSGRDGLGSVYVWAAGNGRFFSDNVNYDGYANSRYAIAVTGIDHNGRQSPDSEPGTAILVSAYSRGIAAQPPTGIITTDRRGPAGFASGDYVNDFSGTSAATSLVSGVVALMLEANPALSWRDVQQILVHTARRNDPLAGDWSRNGAGLFVSHRYGLGAVDAAAAVELARSWTPIGAERTATSGQVVVNKAIPDNSAQGISSSITLAELIRIEKVEVVFDATHPYRGDLSVTLTSPDGTRSILAELHDDPGADYNRWTFTSTHHWDEIAAGTWTLTVADLDRGSVGTWNSWQLNVYGAALEGGMHYIHLDAGQTVSGIDFANQQILPPRAISARFVNDTAPHRIIAQFDPAPASQPLAGDLELVNQTTGQVIDASAAQVAYDPGKGRAVWTFTQLPGGVLPDGAYAARLNPGNYSFKFFHLTGDADGDGAVDHDDFLILQSHFGEAGTFAAGDFDYSGRIDFADFQRLELGFGRKLEDTESISVLESFASRPVAPQPAARPVFSRSPVVRNSSVSGVRPAG